MDENDLINVEEEADKETTAAKQKPNPSIVSNVHRLD